MELAKFTIYNKMNVFSFSQADKMIKRLEGNDNKKQVV